ncbi:hypothetical protein GOODEAATRI_017343, partial [Goodea atripinnis]
SVVDPLSGLPSPCPRDPLLSSDSHMDVQGYKWVRWRVWLFRVATLLSLGLLLIVFHWRPRLAVLNPFYIFQVFSITLWSIDGYYFYALCIFIISVISIGISLYETRKEGLLLPCDAALLAGECLVNECMLTGESVPVLKTPLPAGDRTYSSETERRHTLFCGTHIIQAKGGRPGGSGAVAVVTSTGFFTAKGNLVSSILYPQQINFRFYQDAMKFLLILGGIVPPALPAAITTGTIYAQSRLKKRGIFCISPPRINVCGKVSVFCFDKSSSEAVAIIKRFPFSSALQRMSVVTVAPRGRSALAFLKGSPEMVASLCRPDTGSALLSTQTDRGEVEKEMQFLGLLMMKNLVKPESAEVINILTLAHIRSVMVTGMCGDGANDCGALRAADAGVSLSEAEASVASPFTSKTENISCVPMLIRYMALYSLIQFFSVLVLNTVKTTFADMQFLFCDLFLVTLLAIVMGRGGPSEELYPCRPPASLLSLPVFGSLFIHTCMIVLGQLGAFFITTSQGWYIPLNSTVFGTENLPNMENTCVFALSGYQYIIMAVVVTKGFPHKKPLFYNGESAKKFQNDEETEEVMLSDLFSLT